MDFRRISEEYTEIGWNLIKTMPELAEIKLADVQIAFLASDHEKKSSGKLVFGQCEKVADKYKWSIPFDFTITIFEPNVVAFTKKQLEILIFHELLHIGIDGEKFYTRPHDLEDFRVIIDKYGTGWADPVILPFVDVNEPTEIQPEE